MWQKLFVGIFGNLVLYLPIRKKSAPVLLEFGGSYLWHLISSAFEILFLFLGYETSLWWIPSICDGIIVFWFFTPRFYLACF